MSDAVTHRTERSRLSLRHLLYLTAWIAIGIAVGMAYRQNRYLRQKRVELLALSKGLQVTNEDELISAAMPEITSGFYSWRVHVPDSRDYELRLGIGEVSEKGIPPIVGKVRLSPGQHRITLHRQDSVLEEFRYAVYLDGVQVIEKVMGSNWLASGWLSSRSVSWPRELQASTPLQLSAQSYKPKIEFGKSSFFSSQDDDQLTHVGYRLWIDQVDKEYPPASPFLGFPGDPKHLGIGLRDGLRFGGSTSIQTWNGVSTSSYTWEFTRPSSGTRDTVLHVKAEFIAEDGRKFPSRSFEPWQIRNAASGTDVLSWLEDPAQTVHSAFLHAKSSFSDDLQPIVELQWDASKPDAIGIRLADTPANDKVSRWSLRILDGKQHLWREIQAGEVLPITPEEAITQGTNLDQDSKTLAKRVAVLNLGDLSKPSVELHWKTDETLPLQIVKQRDSRYAYLNLYLGLPLSFGMQVPTAMKPIVSAEVEDLKQWKSRTTIPGGPVFSEIRVDVEATTRDWIWLSATSNP